MIDDPASHGPRARTRRRRRLPLGQEYLLALPPTAAILAIFAFVETLTSQRLLFASLAASAFLIYVDPRSGANATRTLVAAQLLAAGAGWLADLALGPGYVAGSLALVVTIAVMIALDTVHPPAVATALGFAFRAGDASNLLLFGLAVGVTAVLVVLEHVTLRQLEYSLRRNRRHDAAPDAGEASETRPK